MADKSDIEWTDATWNPVTGCTKVSPGCDHCYAETFAERFRGIPGHHFENGFDLTLRPERIDQPLRWQKPRRIFVNSMSDLFHDDVPDIFIEQVFDVMEQAKRHTFQLLTKRHARMRSFVNGREARKAEYAAKFDDCPTEAMRNSPAAQMARKRAERPPANIWLGVSVEDQKWADIRIPALLDTSAAVRWISAEPLLGPVDLSRWTDEHAPWHYTEFGVGCSCGAAIVDDQDRCNGSRLGWVVVGGESGPGSRPMHPQWARNLRDQCAEAGVPFLFKQHGQYAPVTDRPQDGDRWLAYDGAETHWQYDDGHIRAGLGDFQWPGTKTVLVRRARSKHDAGRLLDGRTWDEYPGERQAVSA